jgi:hypothetical protein
LEAPHHFIQLVQLHNFHYHHQFPQLLLQQQAQLGTVFLQVGFQFVDSYLG